MLYDRISDYAVMLFGGLIGITMIIVHSKGIVVNKSGGSFFVWTLFALTTTGWFTAILSARGIWIEMRRKRASRHPAAL